MSGRRRERLGADAVVERAEAFDPLVGPRGGRSVTTDPSGYGATSFWLGTDGG